MASDGRASWGNQIEFILTLVGLAVGLGNVWRFPYLVFRNGGGAFLIPYFLSLFILGIPLFFMELSFGQFASLGPVKIWAINPAMKGLGFSMVLVSAFIALYYNVIISVCVYYFFASMTSKLPWSTCEDFTWASCYCRDSTMNNSDPDPWNSTRMECVRQFNATPFERDKVTSPSEDYFNRRVLHLSSNLADSGTVRWDLALCLLLAWTLVFLVLTKGIKSLGKVVYFTAIFPYIILTILLIRAVTLEGHREGVDFYLNPDIEKLGSAAAWSDAAVQIFYSLSVGQGGLIAMASYNQFNNNVLRDALLVPIIDAGTCFFAGFVIFSTLGFMAHNKGVSVANVAVGGPGLAFIAYPEAIAQMPVAPLWSILFFLMMMTLGFSSQFSIVETVLTGLTDEFPILSKSKKHALIFRGSCCVLGFLLGLPMVSEAGFHMLDIVDNATGGFPLLFVGLIEVICIIFVYGYQRFRRDIEMMIGATKFTRYMFYYFAPMWIVFTPLGLLAVIIFRCIQYEPLSVTTPDIFPAWADAIWWLIVIACFIAIPALFFVKFCKNGGNVVLHKVTSPSAAWRPQLSANCTGDYSKFAAVKSKKEQSPEKETEFDIHDIVAMPTLEAHLTATAREESEMTNGTVLETYDASGLGYDNMGYHRGYDVSEYKAHNAGFNQGNDKEEGTSESSARVHHPVATKL